MQYLIPIQKNTVHPSVTIDEAANDMLSAANAKKNGLRWASMRDDGEVVTFTASARRGYDELSLMAAAEILISALYGREIMAYVQDPCDGVYYRLPHDYWQEVNAEMDCERVLKMWPDVPDEAIGRIILIEEQALNLWVPGKISEVLGKIEPDARPQVKQQCVHPTLPRERVPSRKKAKLAEFLGKATAHLPGGTRPMSKTDLRKKYREYLRDDAKTLAYGKSEFDRLVDKWIGGSRW